MAVVDDLNVFEDEGGRGSGGPLGKIFGVAFDPRTYGAIFYMLLALPLGIGYFTFVTVGLSLSIGLLVLIIGVLVALLFLALTRGLSIVEGFITGALLGARIPHRDDDAEQDGSDDEDTGNQGGIWSGIKRMFADTRTWTSMIYMALMLPLGVAYFTIVITGFTTAIATMLAPFASLFSDQVHIANVSGGEPEFVITLAEFANSPVGMIAMTIFGFVLFFVMLYLSRGIGWMHARFAEKMLVKRS